MASRQRERATLISDPDKINAFIDNLTSDFDSDVSDDDDSDYDDNESSCKFSIFWIFLLLSYMFYNFAWVGKKLVVVTLCPPLPLR